VRTDRLTVLISGLEGRAVASRLGWQPRSRFGCRISRDQRSPHKMAVLPPIDHVILKDSRHASLRGDGPGVLGTPGPQHSCS